MSKSAAAKRIYIVNRYPDPDVYKGPFQEVCLEGPSIGGPSKSEGSLIEIGKEIKGSSSKRTRPSLMVEESSLLDRRVLEPYAAKSCPNFDFVPGIVESGGEADRHVLALQPRAAGEIFVRDFFIDKSSDGKIVRRDWDAFGQGAKLTTFASNQWHRYHRKRDVAILIMLSQLGYLTTSDIADLFWPLRGYALWHARRRLRWLLNLRLVMRWWRLLPNGERWSRLPSVFLLTQPGAAIAAEHAKAPVRAAIQRSRYRADGVGPVLHDLAANNFMRELASAAAVLDGEGLYSWVSEPSMRRVVQLGQEIDSEMADLAPDGWGRYLTPDGETDFYFEYDRGTEKPIELAVKASRYLRSANRFEQVLFLLPNAARERSVRRAIEKAGAGRSEWEYRGVKCWTSTVQRMSEQGVLGPIWQGFEGAERVGIAELPKRPVDSGIRAEHSISKPGWWEHRPGAGEGM